MKPIVLDNSVLIEILLEKEERSDQAISVYNCIQKLNTEIYLPYFALFEIKSAISNKKINHGNIEFRKILSKESPLKCKYFPVNEKFVTTHLNSKIGYLKAADYIYVCLASQEDAILITEDNTQHRISKEAGIETYKLEEFVKKYG